VRRSQGTRTLRRHNAKEGATLTICHLPSLLMQTLQPSRMDAPTGICALAKYLEQLQKHGACLHPHLSRSQSTSEGRHKRIEIRNSFVSPTTSNCQVFSALRVEVRAGCPWKSSAISGARSALQARLASFRAPHGERSMLSGFKGGGVSFKIAVPQSVMENGRRMPFGEETSPPRC